MKQEKELRVATFFADGLEECEALIVCDVLYRAGMQVERIAVGDNLAITSSHGVVLVCDKSVDDEDFSFEDYDLLFLPGGIPGTPNLQNCKKLCDALVAAPAKGQELAAICAAPTVFGELGLLKGKNATCNPGFQDKLVQQGAQLIDKPVVRDGVIATSQAVGTAFDLALELVEHFLGHEKAQALKEDIVYQTK